MSHGKQSSSGKAYRQSLAGQNPILFTPDAADAAGWQFNWLKFSLEKPLEFWLEFRLEFPLDSTEEKAEKGPF